MQVVIFKLSKEQFAVETEKVKSITDMMEVTKVPKAPSYIKGLINLRGNVISLLDINLLLELDNLDYEKEEKSIIILNLEDEDVGIAVDEVHEVLEITEDIIEKEEESKEKPYIKGVINFKDRIVTLIDIYKLIPNY